MPAYSIPELVFVSSDIAHVEYELLKIIQYRLWILLLLYSIHANIIISYRLLHIIKRTDPDVISAFSIKHIPFRGLDNCVSHEISEKYSIDRCLLSFFFALFLLNLDKTSSAPIFQKTCFVLCFFFQDWKRKDAEPLYY